MADDAIGTDVAAGAGIGTAIEPGFGTAIGAAGGLILGGATDLFQNNAAQQQMSFQNQESSTAYQRGTLDMELAGLNPALMYGANGSPASSPGGAQPQFSVPDINMPSITSAANKQQDVDQQNQDRAQRQQQFGADLEQKYSKIAIDKAIAGSTISRNAHANPNTDADTALKTQQKAINQIDSLKGQAATSAVDELKELGHGSTSYTVPPPKNPSITDAQRRAKISDTFWKHPQAFIQYSP